MLVDHSRAAGSSGSSSCSDVHLHLRKLVVRDPDVLEPGATVTVQCHTTKGRVFDVTSLDVGQIGQPIVAGVQFFVDLPVANVTCREAVSCRIDVVASGAEGGTVSEIIPWSLQSCWFRYDQFMTPGAEMWACQDGLDGSYVLQCVDCNGSRRSPPSPQGSGDDDSHSGSSPDSGTLSGADGDGDSSNSGGGGGGMNMRPAILYIILILGALGSVLATTFILAYVRGARRNAVAARAARRAAAGTELPEPPQKLLPMYCVAPDGPSPSHLGEHVMGPVLVVGAGTGSMMLAQRDWVPPVQPPVPRSEGPLKAATEPTPGGGPPER